MGRRRKKKKEPQECDLEDLVLFEKFIAGKNGDFTHDDLVSMLTYARLDECMAGAPDERQKLLLNNYDAALRDPDRLGYIIVEVYEDVFHGERNRFPNGIYEGHQGKLNFKFMLRYALSAKKKWKKEEIPQKIGKKEIRDLKLGRGLDKLFHNCPPEAVMFCYPEMALKEWYFGTNPENIWYEKNEDGKVKQDDKGSPVVDYKKAAEAAREFVGLWLAKLDEKEVKDALKSEKGTPFEGLRINKIPAVLVPRMIAKDFSKPILPYGANLKHMLKVCFGDSPEAAIMNAYPDMPFKSHYFQSCPDNYWINKDKTPNMENIIAATREFCGIWLEGKPISALVDMRHEFFENGLFPGGSSASGMIQQCMKFGGLRSYTDILIASYPLQFKVAKCREVGRQKKLVYVGND